MKNADSFELDSNDRRIKVSRHAIGTQIIFRIIFPDRRQPLVVTRATHSKANNFWTSIPEGRQKEAEEFGTLISEYLKTFE